MEECSSEMVGTGDRQELAKEKYSARINRIIVCTGIFVGAIWSGMSEGCAGAVSSNFIEPISLGLVNHFRAWAVPLGIVCSSLLMKSWGRRNCLLMANIVSVFGCICLFFTEQMETVTVGCVLIWFSGSAYLSTVRVYVAEITSPKLRGFLGVLISIAVVCGSIFNPSLRTLAAGRYGVRACFSMSIISLFLTSYIKESPFWLHLQNESDKAREVFLWIRGYDSKSEEELNALLAGEVNPKARLLTKQFFNAFFIMVAMMLMKRASNLDLIKQKELEILNTHFDWPIDICSIFLESLMIFPSAVLCALILKVPRRILFFISAAGALISLLSWSCVMSLSPSWDMDLLSLVIFRNISAFMGLNQIPWIIATEIFPNQSRDVGFCCSALLYTLLKKLIYDDEAVFTYWLHLTLMLMGSIIAFFIMPETGGITLQRAENKISTEFLKYF